MNLSNIRKTIRTPPMSLNNYQVNPSSLSTYNTTRTRQVSGKCGFENSNPKVHCGI